MNKEIIIITKYHSFNFEYRVANCNGQCISLTKAYSCCVMSCCRYVMREFADTLFCVRTLLTQTWGKRRKSLQRIRSSILEEYSPPSRGENIRRRLKIFESLVESVALYGAEI